VLRLLRDELARRMIVSDDLGDEGDRGTVDAGRGRRGRGAPATRCSVRRDMDVQAAVLEGLVKAVETGDIPLTVSTTRWRVTRAEDTLRAARGLPARERLRARKQVVRMRGASAVAAEMAAFA
jgi:hypothetical protein